MKYTDFLTERDKEVFTKAGIGQKKQELGKRPIFLVVDTTYEFVGPEREPIFESIKKAHWSCGLEGYDAVDSIKRMLPFARASNIPIVYTMMDRTMATPFDKKDARSDENYTQKNQEWASVVKDIEPAPGDVVIAKLAPSAYFGTKLIMVQMMKNIDTVIIAGGIVSGCVRATVIDAFSYGYKVAVIEEGVFDRGEVPRAINLFDMRCRYADIISEAQAIEYFKSINI